MKQAVFTFVFLITSILTQAQWSVDPANPTIVCDAANTQSTVYALHDGSGGYYVFWRDDRSATTATEIYGQRYDANGTALWQTNGRLIFAQPNRDINHFHVIRNFQGNLFFAVSQGLTNSGDTIVVIKTDSAGNALWSQPTLVAGRTTGVIYTSQVMLMEKDTGVYVGYFLIHTGGSQRIYMNRVDDNGNRLWAFNGILVPNSGYGGFGMYPDGFGGLYIYWRQTNGAGTGLGVRRMTENGTFLWASNVNPASGTPGLGYAYSVIPDDNYGLIFTWVEQIGASIKMARIDSSGALVWNPGVLPVCVASSGQDRCTIMKNGNYFYVAWLDNRPPANNSDVYMQRFDMNGIPQWTVDGIRCTSVNTYVPNTRLSPGSNGSVICTVDGNLAAGGFVTQKLNPDSTFAWGAAGVKIANHTFNPSGTDYAMLTPPDSGAVVFWASGGNIYTARVNSNGSMTGINNVSEQSNVMLYPNPANDKIILRFTDIPENSKAEIKILNAVGSVVSNLEVNDLSDEMRLNTTSYNEGLYFINVVLTTQQNVVSSSTRKFIVNHK